MKTLLTFACALGTTLLVPDAVNAEDGTAVSDLHNSVLHRLFTSGVDLSTGVADTRYPVNLTALKPGDAKFIFLSIGIPRFDMRGSNDTTLDDIILFFEEFRQLYDGPDETLAFAADQREMNKVLESGRIAYSFALEGSHLLGGDISGVDRLHAAGVRMIGIAHWFQNDFFTDPAEPVRPNKEPRYLYDRTVLSEKGRTLIERMIEKKILIDVSHLRAAAFDAVVELNAGRTPLVASHSNARALCDVPRNLEDSQIRAIAKTGGVIGICLHQPLLVGASERATVMDVVDQIDHITQLVGAAHVAIGTDFEGRITTPEGLGFFTDLGKIGDEMKARGYALEERNAILWRNALRLLPSG